MDANHFAPKLHMPVFINKSDASLSCITWQTAAHAAVNIDYINGTTMLELALISKEYK